MKLSDAIILGDTLKKADPSCWIVEDGNNFRGCALGGALLAANKTLTQSYMDGSMGVLFSTYLRAEWPWLTGLTRMVISQMYADVCRGRATMDNLIAYVKKIEPADEPAAIPATQTTQKEELVNA